MQDLPRKKSEKKPKVTRRAFLGAATAAAAFSIVPRHVLGQGFTPPSEKLNVAGIGVGGMGGRNICEIAGVRHPRRYGDTDNGFTLEEEPQPPKGENIVALCDVDDEYSALIYDTFPKANKYRDYRKMLETQKDIDALVIATPDHTHAVIAMAAMQLGKHVYCQKPMTRTIYEARMLTEAARKYKVITQMGNQGHSGEGVRLICEWIWDGAIGDVREVHAYTNRPVWPQAIARPEDRPAVPPTLDWDLFLGPAPERPYHPAYHPFAWRGWWDFGTGALGDMACHVLDPVFWSLKLKYPTQVEACFTKINYSKNIREETAPLSSIVHFQFPQRGDMPPVKVHWYDGGMMPARPEGLEPGRKLAEGDQSGVLFIGEKGMIMCGEYGNHPRIAPETAMRAYQRPPKTIARINMSHEKHWVQCCKDNTPACSNFDYAGPFTEMVLLGNLAIRTGEPLEWDGENMKATNVPEANEYVNPPYRQGWSL
ncbi:MAG: Gfo/Idh/MocA family oxidoreductase [Sedimentisphaerales bacterium]|nr:Gfo/Idh/MocA family oxidoreductase [Sedimentisphaerales bacterium]